MSYQRRTFLQKSAIGISSLAFSSLASMGPLELLAAERQPTSRAASERLGVAVVGIGGRGRKHISEWASSAGKNSEVLYLCEVDKLGGRGRVQGVRGQQSREPKFIKDFRHALDDPAVDIVSIATPNHWHALQGILALQAGKHVYVEKPVSHNVWEGRQLANWTSRQKLVCQCGTQARSSTALAAARRWLLHGNLGKVKLAVGVCYNGRRPIGRLDKPLQIPKTIDYDLWCGPAEKVHLYRPRLHYDWHWDLNTGNGDMGNQGIHQMDIARWFLGETELSPRVVSIGGRLGYEDAGNTPNTQVVLHAYERAPLIFETRGLPHNKAAQATWKPMDRYGGYQDANVAVIVRCERGTMVIPSSYTQATAYDHDRQVIQTWATTDDSSGDPRNAVVTAHFDNFARAVRAGNQEELAAPVVEGHLSSALCHTGNISHRLGRPATAEEAVRLVSQHEWLADAVQRMVDHLRLNKVNLDGVPALTVGPWLKMDPRSETFYGHEEANTLLSREYRTGFEVPAVTT